MSLVVAAEFERSTLRCFAGDEGQPGELMATLGRDVTVVDPREAEAALRDEFGGGRSPRDAERDVTAFLARRIKSKEADVPMVEDFPLAPEEETPDFQHLATTLQFRCIRAIEHWRGNTHLTLAAIITRHMRQALSDVPEERPRSSGNDHGPPFS